MEDFTELVDLASERLGGAVLDANDEFFAPKENLLKPETPVFDPDRYTDRGKEMDGWETARAIRRRFGPELAIILITGHGAATPIAPGDKHLVNGIIGKPFNFDQVAEAITQATQKAVTSDK